MSSSTSTGGDWGLCTCPVNTGLNLAGLLCVACPASQTLIGGQCTCPSNTVPNLMANMCIVCPANQLVVSGVIPVRRMRCWVLKRICVLLVQRHGRRWFWDCAPVQWARCRISSFGTLGSRQGSLPEIKRIRCLTRRLCSHYERRRRFTKVSDIVNIRQTGLSEVSRCPNISKPFNPNPPRPFLKPPYLRGGSLAEFCRYHLPSL